MPDQMVPTAVRIAPGIVYHGPAGAMNVPAGQAQAQTNIDIFAIHKVPQIKASDPSKCL